MSKQSKQSKQPTQLKQTWQLFGNEYDLDSFVKHHPGGELAIRLSQKGSDRVSAERLFRSYHVWNDRHLTSLARFKVGEVGKADKMAPTKKNSASNPSEAQAVDRKQEIAPFLRSAFHEDVKGMVRAHFKGKGSGKDKTHKASSSHLVMCGVFAVLCLLTWVVWLQGGRGSSIALLFLPFISWLLCCNTSHDGSHFAFSSHPTVNALMSGLLLPFFGHPLTWYQQHLVSHHTRTNEVDHDIDLYHFFPTSFHRLIHSKSYLRPLIYVFASTAGLVLVVPFMLFSQKGGSKIYHRLFDFNNSPGGPSMSVGLSVSMWGAIFLLSRAYGVSLLSWVYLYGCSSLIYLLFTQVSHIQEQMQEETEETDFHKRQVMASINYHPTSRFWTVVSGGLNSQSLHHTLPGICSCHFPDIYPAFEKVCLKHGVPVPVAEGNVFSALLSAFRYIIRLNMRD